MSLCTLGVTTALILDVGYVEAVLIPVFEGVPVLHAWQAQPRAAEAVER
jgi:actin-related protein 10